MSTAPSQAPKMIHPVLFLYPENSEYSKWIMEMIDNISTVTKEAEEIIWFEHINDAIDIQKILAHIPTWEKRIHFRAQTPSVHIEDLFVINIVDTSAHTDKYLSMLSKICNHEHAADLSRAGIYMFNFFIKNLNRETIHDENANCFFQNYEATLKQPKISDTGTRIFNIVIDNFHGEYCYKISTEKDVVFMQMEVFIKALICNKHPEDLTLSKSISCASSNTENQVKYNIIGIASVGISTRKFHDSAWLYCISELLKKITTPHNISTTEKIEIQIAEYKLKIDVHIKKLEALLLADEKPDSFEEYGKTLKNVISNTGDNDDLLFRLGAKIKEISREYEAELDKYDTNVFDKIKSEYVELEETIITYLHSVLSQNEGTEALSVAEKAIKLLKETFPKEETGNSRTPQQKIKQQFKNILSDMKSAETEVNETVSLEEILKKLDNLEINLKSFPAKNKKTIPPKKSSAATTALLQERDKKIRDYRDTLLKYVSILTKTYSDKYNEKVVRSNRLPLTECVVYIEKHEQMLKAFREELKRALVYFADLYKKTKLKQDYFNQSLVDKENVADYCRKEWLAKKDLQVTGNEILEYYKEYIKEYHLFSTTKNISKPLPVHKDEKIKHAENGLERNIKYEKFSPKNKSATLFAHGNILPAAIRQGDLKDCYLLAALAAIAHKDPLCISAMTREVGDQYKVELFTREEGGMNVFVDNQFWVDEEGIPIYAKPADTSKDKLEIWPMVIEKAWAKLNDCDYKNIDNDMAPGQKRAHDFSFTLTRKEAIREQIKDLTGSSSSTFKRIVQHLQSKPVVIYTKHSAQYGLQDNHAYAILDINESTRRLKLFDPKNGTTENEFQWSELLQNLLAVLYFSYDNWVDTHLYSIHPEGYLQFQVGCRNLVVHLRKKVNKEFDENIGGKSLEDILKERKLDISVDDTKAGEFASRIIEDSQPFVFLYRYKFPVGNLFFLERNRTIEEMLSGILRNKRIDADRISNINCGDKKIGLLRVCNNLVLRDLTGPEEGVTLNSQNTL